MPSNKIAFIKRGSFSNTNGNVLEALLREFPDHHIDVLDILDLIPGSHPSLKFRILSTLYAYKEFGWWLLTGREKMNGAGGCKIRTAYFFATLNAAIRRYLAKDKYRFTFQMGPSSWEGTGRRADQIKSHCSFMKISAAKNR